MIELNRHIEILLLTNDCVIIPGFGGFMAHHVDAHFDGADNMFLPPYRTIGFNPSLTINDSLLAQSYVEAYDISYPEAMRMIESEVKELRRKIDNEGNYEFNSIGSISRNADGKYTFEPYEGGILTPEYYGLAGFSCPRLPALPHSAVAERTVPEEVATPQATEEAAPAPILPIGMDEDEAEKTVSIRVSWLRNVAAVLLTVVTFFLLPEQIGSHSTEAGPNLSIGFLQRIMPSARTIEPATPQPATEEKKAEEPVQEAVEAAEPQEPQQVAEAETDYYCVVLASQVSQKNAQAFIERLAARGVGEARVMESPSGNKVVVGHFADEHEATNVKRQLSRQAETADCWVMHVKP